MNWKQAFDPEIDLLTIKFVEEVENRKTTTTRAMKLWHTKNCNDGNSTELQMQNDFEYCLECLRSLQLADIRDGNITWRADDNG